MRTQQNVPHYLFQPVQYCFMFSRYQVQEFISVISFQFLKNYFKVLIQLGLPPFKMCSLIMVFGSPAILLSIESDILDYLNFFIGVTLES